MAEASATDFCNRHADQAATGRCDHCGKPFCRDCHIEDVGAEEEFCSVECRERRVSARPGDRTATQEELLEGADHPILTGWKLWARSLPALCSHGFPFILVTSFVAGHALRTDKTLTLILVVLLIAFGVALAQVVLTQRHTGLIQGNAYLWTLKRFIPWLITNIAALQSI